MASEHSKILLKNIGFESNFFESLLSKNSNDYRIVKDKLQKNFSGNNIQEVGFNNYERQCREAEDAECYEDDIYRSDQIIPINQEACYDITFIPKETNFTESNEEMALTNTNINVDNNNIQSNFNFEIFKDNSLSQFEKLESIVKQIINYKKANSGIKAYKSKLKSRFYKIYEQNSLMMKEKSKFKIFHKCSFLGCQRTFSTSGWLKAHFNEHMKELQENEFNKLFSKAISKCSKLDLS